MSDSTTTATRSWLERWKSLGHRLTATDEERLYEMEATDDVFCPSCGVYYALHCDEARYKDEARARHMASEDHKRGPQ